MKFLTAIHSVPKLDA